MVSKEFLATTIIGICLLFIINEFVTIAAYLKFKKYIDPRRVQPSDQGVIDTL